MRSALLVIGALLAAGCSGTPSPSTQGNESGTPSTTASVSSTPTASASATPSATPAAGTSVRVLSERAYRDSVGYLHVVGEVANEGAQNARLVEISATFYDAAGNVAKTGIAFAMRDVVPAGQKSPFEATVEDADARIVTHKLIVSSQPTTRQPVGNGKLVVLHDASETDSIGYWHARGEVRNDADRTAKFVKVVVTAYDASGKVAAAILAFTNPSDLPPGQTAPFDALASTDDTGPIASYRIDVEASALQ